MRELKKNYLGGFPIFVFEHLFFKWLVDSRKNLQLSDLQLEYTEYKRKAQF